LRIKPAASDFYPDDGVNRSIRKVVIHLPKIKWRINEEVTSRKGDSSALGTNFGC
jgi:hypothetical protein